eukprot:TRINITY_DN22519_c0_g1_i1.p1 TRINITY_DN22519_c0_g1~~TRINITY_DN22519_c0_g1_i1.p1  ORF type:complete len:826 (+),score=280.38 TRINITY_DN22519_c0_g1_i1:160-2637(+)
MALAPDAPPQSPQRPHPVALRSGGAPAARCFRVKDDFRDSAELYCGTLSCLGVFDPPHKRGGGTIGRAGRGFQNVYAAADPTSLSLWRSREAYQARDYTQQLAVLHYRHFDAFVRAFASDASPEDPAFHPNAKPAREGPQWHYFGLRGATHTVLLATPQRVSYDGWTAFLIRQLAHGAAFYAAYPTARRTVQTQVDFITKDHPKNLWRWSCDVVEGGAKSLAPGSPFHGAASPAASAAHSPTTLHHVPPALSSESGSGSGGNDGGEPHTEPLGTPGHSASPEAELGTDVPTSSGCRTDGEGEGEAVPALLDPAAWRRRKKLRRGGTKTPVRPSPRARLPETQTPEGARAVLTEPTLLHLQAQLKELVARLGQTQAGENGGSGEPPPAPAAPAPAAPALTEGLRQELREMIERLTQKKDPPTEEQKAAEAAALRAELRGATERLLEAEQTIAALKEEARKLRVKEQEKEKDASPPGSAVLRWAGQASTPRSRTSADTVVIERQQQELDRLRGEVDRYRNPEHAGMVAEVVRLSQANRDLQRELEASRGPGGAALHGASSQKDVVASLRRQLEVQEKLAASRLLVAERSRDAVVDRLRLELSTLRHKQLSSPPPPPRRRPRCRGAASASGDDTADASESEDDRLRGSVPSAAAADAGWRAAPPPVLRDCRSISPARRAGPPSPLALPPPAPRGARQRPVLAGPADEAEAPLLDLKLHLRREEDDAARFHSNLWSDGWALRQVSSFDDPQPLPGPPGRDGFATYPLVNRTWRFVCTDAPHEVVLSLLVVPADGCRRAPPPDAHPRASLVTRYGPAGDEPPPRARRAFR